MLGIQVILALIENNEQECGTILNHLEFTLKQLGRGDNQIYITFIIKFFFGLNIKNLKLVKEWGGGDNGSNRGGG